MLKMGVFMGGLCTLLLSGAIPSHAWYEERNSNMPPPHIEERPLDGNSVVIPNLGAQPAPLPASGQLQPAPVTIAPTQPVMPQQPVVAQQQQSGAMQGQKPIVIPQPSAGIVPQPATVSAPVAPPVQQPVYAQQTRPAPSRPVQAATPPKSSSHKLTPPPQQCLKLREAGVKEMYKPKDHKTASIGGAGKGLALSQAAKFLIPKGWKFSVADAIKDIKVTWDSKGETVDWVTVLDTATKAASVCAVVSWKDREVAFVPMGTVYMAGKLPDGKPCTQVAQTKPKAKPKQHAAKSKPKSSQQAAQAAPSAGRHVAQAKPKPKPKPKPQPPKAKEPVVERYQYPAPIVGEPTTVKDGVVHTWVIRPGLLAPQVLSWCELSGYQLVWNVSTDYNLSGHVSFSGSFQKAIKELFEGLERDHVMLRVKIFEGNRVVEVVGG